MLFRSRRIVGWPGVDANALCTVVREAIFNTRYRRMYQADAYVGLDEDFMVKAHLLLPEGYENNLYNWMINFQYDNERYRPRYAASRRISDTDGDIFFFADPDWSHPEKSALPKPGKNEDFAGHPESCLNRM